jgi:hypothetical protein
MQRMEARCECLKNSGFFDSSVRSFVKEACAQGQVRFTGSALSSAERQIGHD